MTDPTPPTDATRRLPACGRCEALPARPQPGGWLHLWFPLGHTFGKIAPWLTTLETAIELAAGDGYLAIALPADPAGEAAILDGLAARLQPGEREDTRALFMPDGRAPGLPDYGRVTSLAGFLATAGSAWLIDMLEAERFTSWFQPIVEARATGTIFAHEALFRGLDGEGRSVSPARVFGTAREAGLLFQVDLQARRSAIRSAARHDLASSLFINFNPAAIYDPAFCLRSTLRAVDEAGLPHERVVFEVVESEQVADPDHLVSILDTYRRLGFGVALDDLGAGFSSLNLLHRLRPDFVKLDMDLIRGVDLDPYKAILTSKVLELASHLGVRTIAEGVETPGELAWLQGHGATYVQGYLIARPAPEPLRSGTLAALPA